MNPLRLRLLDITDVVVEWDIAVFTLERTYCWGWRLRVRGGNCGLQC
jgi:hypothetical protein